VIAAKLKTTGSAVRDDLDGDGDAVADVVTRGVELLFGEAAADIAAPA
jgi:hypothetical protein